MEVWLAVVGVLLLLGTFSKKSRSLWVALFLAYLFFVAALYVTLETKY